MIRKATTGIVKADKDPMVLDIVGSTEQVDRDGDIVRLEGWDLKAYRQNPVFMWAHNYTLPPLGKAVQITQDYDSRRLLFRIKFSEHNPMAVMVAKMYHEGVLNATSVGFAPTKPPKERQKAASDPEHLIMGKEYNGQELLELSAVPIPSNPGAVALALSKGFVTKSALEDLGFAKDLLDAIVMKPLPEPGDEESEKDFIGRCMGDEHMNDKFPEQEQRAGVCYSIWRKNKFTLEERIVEIEQQLRVIEKARGTGRTLEPGSNDPMGSPGGRDPVHAKILDMAQRAKALSRPSLERELQTLAQQLHPHKET